MDAHLKLLADASLEVAAAEDALAEGAFHSAVERLEQADVALAELRERWAGMSAAEKAVVGSAAQGVRARRDAAQHQIPPLSALTVGTPVSDPEQDSDPDQ